MAITKQDIYAAADALVAEGKAPTLANVRRALGGGSFTTISEGVAAWKEDRTAQPAVLQEPPPVAVTEKFGGLLAEVWAVALQMANARLASEREALEAARVQLVDEQRQAADLAAQVSADLDQAIQERDRLASALDAAVAAGTEQGEQLASITKDLADAQQRTALAEQSAKDHAQRADDLARALHAEQANTREIAGRAERAQAEAASNRAESDRLQAEVQAWQERAQAEAASNRAEADRLQAEVQAWQERAAQAERAQAEVRGALAALNAELERQRGRVSGLDDEPGLGGEGVPQNPKTSAKSAGKNAKKKS